jgi:hypothetical protein
MIEAANSNGFNIKPLRTSKASRNFQQYEKPVEIKGTVKKFFSS